MSRDKFHVGLSSGGEEGGFIPIDKVRGLFRWEQISLKALRDVNIDALITVLLLSVFAKRQALI